MSFLQSALDLAAKGFHVFPLIPDSKLPAIEAFPLRATRDPEQIRRWWVDPVMGWEQDLNIGISTSRFSDDEALLVVDVDNKGEKKGDETILRLEIGGFELPETFSQITPTGGRHVVYRVREAVKQGVDVLGPGVDTRSRGGYIVGAGSKVDAGIYDLASGNSDVRCAPEWIIERCGEPHIRKTAEGTSGVYGDSPMSRDRATLYLGVDAPIAIEGAAGDHTAYMVAARLKDLGVAPTTALELLAEIWNPRCEPPWGIKELERKVANAYRYGSSAPGVAAPETQFVSLGAAAARPEASEEKLHPFLELNKQYAFVITGGKSHVLWETKDADGKFKLAHLDTHTFHQKFAPDRITVGERSQPLTEMWIRSSQRREYDGICFMPGLESPPRFYNLWRGFNVDPLHEGESGTQEGKSALASFLSHAYQNVCGSDDKLFSWLMGYFAHLIQRPWEKPLVALVFRGRKGVGKNALIDVIGRLLGCHYLVTANKRYLIGNFNGHLENLLLFVLDEAFWSGDKQAEGVLKDLITGHTHVIEHKGQSTYEVANRVRVVIIGNENWLVPASEDERRFAVFDVGDGRKQDRAYFQSMREGMERGGYEQLLRYLLDFDISKTDPNDAPQTRGLMDQKAANLDPIHQWWFDCITEGEIVGGDFEGVWPAMMEKNRLRGAFRRYSRDHNISGRVLSDIEFGRLLKKCLPKIRASQQRVKGGEDRLNVYELPDLYTCRRSWCKFIGHEVEWPSEG